jgi:hypothetical protein
LLAYVYGEAAFTNISYTAAGGESNGLIEPLPRIRSEKQPPMSRFSPLLGRTLKHAY